MTLRELQRLTLEQLAAAQAQPGQYTLLRDTMDAQSAVFAEQEARFTDFYAGAAAEMVGFTELLDVLDAPKHRGAFYCLGLVGLAVAWVKDVAAARDQALADAAAKVCLRDTGGTCTATWPGGRNKCYCQDIRALKVTP